MDRDAILVVLVETTGKLVFLVMILGVAVTLFPVQTDLSVAKIVVAIKMVFVGNVKTSPAKNAEPLMDVSVRMA
ncbi:MAG: hypothetical protein E6Q68_02625 [Polynucleobacter sp.]|nr:MAG: hypothetical protein E6Q68_02625 [Polynucleobacter sp.]